MESMPPDSEILKHLIAGALGRAASEASRTIQRLASGASGMPVFRCRIDTTPEASLVIKRASLRERRVLALLTDQKLPGAPKAFCLDTASGELDWVCLEDCGDTSRPCSLAPITDDELRREAKSLAAIHAANRNVAHEGKLDWLPRLDET